MILYQYVIPQFWLLQELMYLGQMNQFNDAQLGLGTEELMYIATSIQILKNRKEGATAYFASLTFSLLFFALLHWLHYSVHFRFLTLHIIISNLLSLSISFGPLDIILMHYHDLMS